MLNNHLYTVVCSEKQETLYYVEVALNPENIIYKSHFPGKPITPGVCIIQMLKELVEMIKKQSYMIFEVKNVKFLKIIDPIENSPIDFFIALIDEKGILHVSAEIKREEETFARLILFLSESHA
ncbi:MAG: hydroxymyristoyl-ACP dehydratase [Parabacteroides sp.]|nr:hydroxymyristoyl-ACP dehydratase [Parabacteroides sp.]